MTARRGTVTRTGGPRLSHRGGTHHVVELAQLAPVQARGTVHALLAQVGFAPTSSLDGAQVYRCERRPRWAVAAGLLLAPFTFGLSLLVLRRRVGTQCLVWVEESIGGARLEVWADGPDDDRRLDGVLRTMAGSDHGTAIVLKPDGAGAVPLVGPVVLGRDPAAVLVPVSGTGATAAARPAVVLDPSGRVSRTHATVGIDESGVWVADQHSRHGTVVVGIGGKPVVCVPGARHRVPVGGHLLLAGLVVQVVADDTHSGATGSDGRRSADR